MVRKNVTVLFGLLLAVIVGCKKVPCYPPEHYAPEPSAPYTAEAVQVSTPNGHILAGTLTLPSDASPPLPAVLLITGSSPQERDHSGSTAEPFRRYRPFRQIADAISRQGMAVLRMDDQGVGCSGGGPFEEVTIQERADDSRAGIAYLRGRKEIDPERIGLLGLSEGGNIGPMIAASDPSIRAVVILGGSATNGMKIIEYQRRLKIDERSDLTAGEKKRDLAESMKALQRALAHEEGKRWLRSFLVYLPLPTAKKVGCPVLILHGDKDAHVPVEHAHLLAGAMRAGGNPNVTVRIFENHNHLLLEDPVGSISGYRQLLEHTHELSEEVLSTITDWLSVNLAGR